MIKPLKSTEKLRLLKLFPPSSLSGDISNLEGLTSLMALGIFERSMPGSAADLEGLPEKDMPQAAR